ncbi:MAG: hypothetical protein MHM6MM_001431 [Cercozoa sp. M6MM]
MEMPVVQALLGNVLRQYGLQLANFEGLASGGCINNTFFIRANNEDFVLQRVNTQVFANVEALHNNIAMIAAHLQLRGMYCIPEFVAPRGSSSLFVRVNNEIWRLQKRVMNVHSQCDDKVAAAREVGNAFGAFLCALEGIDVSRLVATIPRFHDLELRLEQLEQAVKLDVCQRVAQCQDLLGVAMSYAPQMLRLWQDTLRNLPRRVTHNDTKIDKYHSPSRSKDVYGCVWQCAAGQVDREGTLHCRLGHSDARHCSQRLWRRDSRALSQRTLRSGRVPRVRLRLVVAHGALSH